MTRAEITQLQHDLVARGFGPLKIDGRYGKATEAAYRRYLDEWSDVQSVAPPPPKPWWTSRTVVGLLSLAAAAGLRALGGEIDADQLTGPLGDLIGAVGALLALWGTARRSAPIDTGLVAPGLRLERWRLRRDRLPPRPARAPGAPIDLGYWEADRGPFGAD